VKQDHPLELSEEEMRRLVDEAARRIFEYIASLPRQPAADNAGGAELARSLRESLPERGEPPARLFDLLFERVIPKGFNTAGPGYLAYVPGGGLFHAAVADLIADAVNRYVGVFAAAPGLAQIESNVVRWFCQIVGYPESAGGVLTTGGSLANFSAVVTARRALLPDDFLSGTIYASDQAHHSIRKAARLAGFPADAVREIQTDARFRIRVEALARRMARDRAAGRAPFLIVASAGTTNTGAVDDLESLAALASRERLWLHADAAYGGFFALTPEGRQRLKGLERCDSIVLDPHKSLFLPYGTGSLLVRDVEALKRAHHGTADYMPSMQEDPDLVDFNLISPELSRDWRGLRVWLPIKMHGIEPFRRSLQEKLELARWATDELRRIEEIEILAEPQLSIVAFRWRRRGLREEELNRRNRDLLDRINSRGHVYLTGTMLGDRFAIRICVLSFRTHADRMREGLEDVRAAVRQLAGG
jgi:aromatic-L-amino-acid decarboxylase